MMDGGVDTGVTHDLGNIDTTERAAARTRCRSKNPLSLYSTPLIAHTPRMPLWSYAELWCVHLQTN
jgi:hypothetical protein